MNEILEAIDGEIQKLQQARALLAGIPDVLPVLKNAVRRRGRPKGSTNKESATPAKSVKRTMSTEGRARIAAAQRARWDAQKKTVKAAGKKVSIKKMAKKPIAKPEAAGVEG